MKKYSSLPDLCNYEISENSRSRIINSAIYLFAQKGYADTATKAIASEADVSEALIFKYFTNKQGLLDAATREILSIRLPSILTYRMEEMLTFEKGLDEVVVYEILNSKFEYLSKNSGYFRIIFLENGNNSDVTLVAVRDAVNKFFDVAISYILQLQDKGMFRADVSPRTIIRTFAGSLNFLLMDKKLLQTPLNIEEELKDIVSILKKGVMINNGKNS